jgi:N-methylhydantoinase B
VVRADIDPFQLEIIKNCFDAIADDMALTLMRTSHSGIVRDSLDFSTAICDRDGQTLAQGVCTPMQLGSFYDAMRKLITDWQGRIDPGDVFIFNDPYAAAGQHLPDIYIVMPIFRDDRLCAWATTIAHHSDVGGIVAGSNALGAEEIFQEGLRLPIVKFIESGVPNQALWDVIALNVRTPDKVIGDLQAQIAACKSAEREMTELFLRYGVDTVLAYGDRLQDYAEELTRAEMVERAERWAPYRVPSVVLGDQSAPCAKTRARECPVPDHPCVSDVPPADVVAAVRQLTTSSSQHVLAGAP